MRRITIWLFSTVAAVVLLFSYRTSTVGGPGSTSVAAATDPGTGTSATDPGSGTTGTDPGSGTAGTGGTTFQGSVAQTRWGPVQVTITVTNGRITSVAVPIYPNNNGRDREINAYALPILTKATLAAQNAHIDTVSGATVTSDGYLESLQAALDAAHLS